MNFTMGHVVMISIGLILIFLAIAKGFEPMLLIPIGFGIYLSCHRKGIRAHAACADWLWNVGWEYTFFWC